MCIRDRSLRIDVYEVGNGNQLVKGCTDTDPIRAIASTGFDDIYLNCNYSATFFQGSGAIRTGSHSIEVEATETIANGDTIVCADIKDFTANDSITYQGVVFGGVAEDTTYFVKSISTATNSITISETYDSSTGLAGPIKTLTDATGSMIVNIQTGTGTVWTDPIVYHNGSRLILGKTNSVSRTKASNNGITTGTTVGLSIGNKIQFAADMFGSDITPNQVYYIKTIIDNNEFTISETDGGTVVTLTDQAGISSYVSNDYAIGTQPNGIQAKLVLANPTNYVNGTDFRLFKTTKGQYADYSTSKWVRKESALTEEQLSAVDTHGLYNLNDFLPAKPTAEGVQAISEMFAASVDGELYDPAKWGQFYKPYGLDVGGTSTQSTVAPAQTVQALSLIHI